MQVSRNYSNRALTEEDLERVIPSPADLQALAQDTVLQAPFLLKQVVGYLLQGGYDPRTVILANPALVFLKGYVHAPLQ